MKRTKPRGDLPLFLAELMPRLPVLPEWAALYGEYHPSLDVWELHIATIQGDELTTASRRFTAAPLPFFNPNHQLYEWLCASVTNMVQQLTEATDGQA